MKQVGPQRWRIHLRLIALTTILAGLICVTLQNSAFAQQPASNLAPADKTELPEYAVWRIEDPEHARSANGIYRLQYSHDGKLLASRNRENVVMIYDTQSRKKLCEVSGHENNWIETIDFSPDSKFFMTAAGSNEQIKIWNSQTGRLESKIDSEAKAAYFSDDGTEIIVLGLTHVERYGWPVGRPLSKKKWRNSSEQAMAMSRDGMLVVTFRASRNRVYQTQVVDLENKSRITLDGPTSIPKSVVISPNKFWVAAAYHPETNVQLWDLRDPHKSKYVLAAHKERVQSLAFSPDNRQLVSASWDQKVIAWDLLTRQLLFEFSGHSEHVNATSCSPLDLSIASGATGKSDTSVLVWDFKQRLLGGVSEDEYSFDRIWNGLGASSVQGSIAAAVQLTHQFDQVSQLLLERIQGDISQATSADVDELVKLLDDPRFEVRENATNKLIMMRGKAEAELRRILNQTISAEVRYRITVVLSQSVQRPSINFTDKRRWHRIVLALELVNSTVSGEILQQIAAGHPNVDISDDAESALQRIRLRSSID